MNNMLNHNNINTMRLNVNEVKKYLMSIYDAENWQECVDKQKYGDCIRICKMILKKFPGMFDNYIVEIYMYFSDIAQNLMGDEEDMWGNHCVLTRNGKMYDFARGANCINGIYTMTQRNDSSDKYDIMFTKDEEELILAKTKRYIKSKNTAT